MKLRIGYILVLLVLMSNVFADRSPQDLSNKSVLFLNSYHKGYKWSDDIIKGVEDLLIPHNINLSIEYMDTKNHFDDKFQQGLIEFLNIKYAKDTFDLVITCDDNALDFIYNNRNCIFEHTPVVFCGANYFNKAEYDTLYNTTGISEVAEIEKNIELIQHLHPNCERIFAITDDTHTGIHLQQELERIHKKYSTPYIDVNHTLSEKELQEALNKLGDNDVVLLTFFFRDALGKTYEYDEGTKLITENSNVPVYVSWDFSIENGVIGGYVVDSYAHGKDVAHAAIEVLSGTPIDSIPIKYSTTHNYIFNYPELKENKIKESLIPTNSIILNKPISVFQKYKTLIIFVLFCIFLLIVFIIILSIALNKTRRIKAELEFKQLRLESITSNIPGTVYQLDATNEQRITYISENIELLCNLKANNFIGEKVNVLNNFIYSEDLEMVTETRRRNISQNDFWKIQYRLKVGNDIKWVYEAGRYIRDSSMSIRTMEGIVFDITNEKNIENKLIENKKRYKSLSDELHLIINSIPGLVFYKDTQNHFKYVNKFMADSAGLDRKEMINRNVHDFYRQELADLYFKDDLEVMEQKTAKLNYEEPWEWKDQKGWFLTSKIPHLDHKGNVQGIIGVAIDISHQKNIEYELSDRNKELTDAKSELQKHQTNLESLVKQRTKKVNELNELLIESNAELNATNDDLLFKTDELEQAIDTLKQTQKRLVQSEKMASIGVLTAGIAHEINNPINFINSGLTGLEIYLNEITETIGNNIKNNICTKCNKDTIEIFDTIPELISSMRNGVTRTTEIVKGLRTFSRLDSEIKVEADLHEIIKSTLVILNSKTKNNIEVQEKYEEVPAINCFAGKLGQVFLNLLVNAIEAIEGKGIITIRTYLEGKDMVCVSIKDNGKGIDKTLQTKIFDPFFTTKDVGKGTGLGLAIVHGIIDEHDGTIHLNPSIKQGTEFIIKLPLK